MYYAEHFPLDPNYTWEGYEVNIIFPVLQMRKVEFSGIKNSFKVSQVIKGKDLPHLKVQTM